MNKYLGVLMIQLFFLAPQCWANQVKTILPDETITLSVSNQHLNRVKIQNDKIIQVIGHEQEYQFKTDTQGELLIQTQLMQPITIFIKTEKQYTYGLMLLPKSMASQTIILQSPHDKKPATLNDSMHLLKILEEKKIDNKDSAQIQFESTALEEIDWRLVESVQQSEHALVGNIFEIKNKNNKNILLVGKEAHLAHSNTILLQLQAIELNPNQTTLLYQVNHAR